MRQILLCLELLCFLCAIVARMDVYFEQTKEEKCSERNPRKIVCPSIDIYMQQYNMSSNINLHVTETMNVSSLVRFQNISNLSIVGDSNNAKFVCTKDFLSGFRFVEVQSLTLSNLVIISCGTDYSFQNYNMTIAIIISSCTDITLSNVTLEASKQTSLLIENSGGDNFLHKLHILDNVLVNYSTSRGSFAGGMVMFFDEDTKSSRYEIVESTFCNISTPNYIEFNPNELDVTDWLGYGLGGGISITFSNKSSNHSVLIEKCFFKDNTAPWGGGIHAKFLHSCNNTLISMNNSVFQRCKAKYAGGGIALGFAAHVLSDDYNNSVSIHNTNFLENDALFGAGTYIFSFLGGIQTNENKLIYFFNCTWKKNCAVYSPAVDISPSRFDYLNKGLLPIPEFKDCKFIQNTIYFKEENKTNLVTAGVFVITRFTVRFSGLFLFESNAYNALLLNSGQVILEKNTEVTFTNNRGFRGGAISLHGFSLLLININCKVEFYNNSATEYGGAIFHYTTEQREFFSTRSCFLEYNGNQQLTVSQRNISFVFSGNTAILGGSSIFTSSLFSCFYSYKGSITGHKVTDFLQDIGNFTFQLVNGTTASIGTTGHVLRNEVEHKILTTIPGQYFKIPLTLYDELNQSIKSEFFVQEADTTIHTNMNDKNPFTRNGYIKLYGAENSTGSVIVSTPYTKRILQYSLSVTLLPCPPGFYHKNQYCSCSADDRTMAYPGITKCRQKFSYNAIIQGGYWAGYYPKTNCLYTARCPFQFCNLNTTIGEHLRKLPNLSEALDNFFCDSRRQGILCGQCRLGNSTFYHSKKFQCGKNDTCPYGILYFIISEILPVCIFFILVLLFDFSFTTGARNGFIFFSQMVTILEFEHSSDDQLLKILQTGYSLLYGIFNIDFFSVEQFSFCLFKDATVIDVLAFKYITIGFAFFLVIMVIVCMSSTCCTKFCTAMKKKANTRDSVLHGLSSFIVICYAECVRVSFFILRKTTLRGAGDSTGPTVAFYGGYNYLEKDHIMYAIPAIISLASITFFPAMLLLTYPSFLKILAICKLSEHRLVLGVLRVTRINSLIPMFDVFQSSFKDKFSFFAGLYLIYRVLILTPYSFSNDIFMHTITTALVLLLILGIHSVAQPYKKKIHNVIDSLLFLNLAIINGITLLEVQMAHAISKEHDTLLKFMAYIQVLLIYTPIAAVTIICIIRIYKAIQKLTTRSSEIQSNQEFLIHLDRIDRSIENESDTSDLKSSYTQQTHYK